MLAKLTTLGVILFVLTGYGVIGGMVGLLLAMAMKADGALIAGCCFFGSVASQVLMAIPAYLRDD